MWRAIKSRIAKWVVRRYFKKEFVIMQSVEALQAQIAATQAQTAALQAKLAMPAPGYNMPTAPLSVVLAPAAPVAEVIPEPAPQPVPAMTTPAETTPAVPAFMPDVKMLAPILKIAISTLSADEMLQIFMHVKQGAPGFQQFLDSDIAKVKFKDLYATYCEFLAGRVK